MVLCLGAVVLLAGSGRHDLDAAGELPQAAPPEPPQVNQHTAPFSFPMTPAHPAQRQAMTGEPSIYRKSVVLQHASGGGRPGKSWRMLPVMRGKPDPS